MVFQNSLPRQVVASVLGCLLLALAQVGCGEDSTPSEPEPGPAIVSASPTRATFATNSDERTLTIANVGEKTAEFRLMNMAGDWLTITPNSGSIAPRESRSVRLTVDRTGFSSGVYLGRIVLAITGNLDGAQITTPEIEVELSVQGPSEPSSRSYNLTLKLSGDGVADADFEIRTESGRYSERTNSRGIAEIRIPNSDRLPPHVVMTVDHPRIMPEARTYDGATDATGHKWVNCEPAPQRVLVKEVRLHHLGNDRYGGEANSQLQIPTEGIELNFAFNLTSIPSEMPSVRLFARGVQHRAELKINGTTTDRLNDSAADGSLSRWDFRLSGDPRTILRRGENTLTIKTGPYNESDPWDDIEFCSVVLFY